MLCLWSGPPGSTVWLLLLQRQVLLLSSRLVSSQRWILIYMFTVLIHWRVRVLHADRTTCMCIWTTAEPRAKFSARKTPSNLSLIVPRRCFCCGSFWLSMFVRFLLVFELLFILFRIALWPSAGKDLSLWQVHLCCFNFSAVLVVHVPFPCGAWDRMWNSIVSVPDHCLFIYFE